MSGDGQVWVTSMTTNEDVNSVVTLYHSLKDSGTGKKIAVIASQKLKCELRQALANVFDFVFYLEEDRNTANLQLHDFAKLYTFYALQAFNTAVYLHPKMLVIKQFDEIFDVEIDEGFRLEENSDASLIVIKPSVLLFESVLYMLCETKTSNTDLWKHLNTWTKNQFKTSTELTTQYYKDISNKTKTFPPDFLSTCVVNLDKIINVLNTSDPNDMNTFEKIVSNYWKKLQSEAVLPLLKEIPLNAGNNFPSYPLSKKCRREPIAIVGMSCRYPKSNSLEEFWDLLSASENGISNPPEFRWLREQSMRNVQSARDTKAGFLKDPVDSFDEKFFGISPKEALFMDPQHRILHELVWEALEDACINPQQLRGTSASVFVGSWINNYKDILVNSGNSEFYRVYMGNSIGSCAARLSFMLGITGPSVATESGCSSAMVAVHMACNSLHLKETSTALVCGVNILLHPFDKNDLPMVISPNGHSKTFSDDADGFARAEGAGVLVLKRFSDAVKDGDHIWGLIRGSAISQEGISKCMGTPTVQCETLAMKNALLDAKVRPEEVSYVEAHGTGTVVGDPMEVSAIAKAYNSPKRMEPLIIGSVKTNVGHTESCSGITGIMKVLMAMHHELIPAHRNFNKLNPAINLRSIPAVIPLEQLEWKRCQNKPRIAGVSSFGITGTDAHVILEEPPKENMFNKAISTNNNMQDRQVHILKLSAKTENALQDLINSHCKTIPGMNETIADICYSANTGRADFLYRCALVIRKKSEIGTKVNTGDYWQGHVVDRITSNKICFLFPGQGSQYPGMARELYNTNPVFRMFFDYCDTFLQKMYNLNIPHVLWNDSTAINRTVYSQISIFCVQYALLKVWESWGVVPDYALGHSLGEFAAAVCAGVLSVDEALTLVAERSLLIDSLPEGKMLVVKADKKKVDTIMQQFCNNLEVALDYAAFNSSEQTVVAGDSELILQFSLFCNELGVKCIILNSTHAFHSRHMYPILNKYATVACNVFSSCVSNKMKKCEYISGMKGNVVKCHDKIDPEYWVQHTLKPVKFLKASRKAVDIGCKTFIEIGPQPILSALTAINSDSDLLCLSSIKKTESNWETLFRSLAQLYVKGVEINWQGIDHFTYRNKVRLPHYPFSRKKFWPVLTQQTETRSHVLLGSAIPNPSPIKIFTNHINFNTHEWIKDHVVGSHVIFPGAGFVEICLAAGLTVTQGFREQNVNSFRPVQLENLCIKTPLAIHESKTVQLQTLAELTSTSLESDVNYKINVFQQHDIGDGNSDMWLSHVETLFSYTLNSNDTCTSERVLDIPMVIETQKTDEELIPTFYKKMHSFGLNFGPIFQSIELLWNLECHVLAKVKSPKLETTAESQYIVHPVIIDSMIQALVLKILNTSSKPKLHVPIRIGKFVLYSICNPEHSEFYVQITNNNQTAKTLDECSVNQCSALLLDKFGNKIALMSDVELIQTTVRAIDSALSEQVNPMPNIWEENWRKQASTCGNLPSLTSFPLNTLEQNLIEETSNTNQLQGIQVFDKLEKLVYYNMLKALYNCGWAPFKHQEFNEDELFIQLNIHKEFRRQFRYFLSVLKDEGLLHEENPNFWRVTQEPPVLSKIEENIRTMGVTEMVERFRSTALITKVSQNLVQILKGNQSILSILFPEDSSEPSVSEMYLEYNKLLGFETMVMKANIHWFNAYKTKEPNKHSVCRILEIGAGTGAYTSLFLQVLEECDIQFEYTYTDISVGFFDAAEKKFEKWKKNIKFAKLNIETDPTEQGFIPGYYDYVCASDVLHATKNIMETLENVKILLRPGGVLELCEQFQVKRFITFVFGLLDGFWRFEDLSIRPDHCILTQDKWTSILAKAGFDIFGIHSSGQGLQGYIKCRRSLETPYKSSLSENHNSKTWVIFHEPNSIFSESLIETMRQLTFNRNIVVVLHEKYIAKCINSDVTKTLFVNPENEDDFKTLLTNMVSNGIQLEGILYCWSLSSQNCTGSNLLKPYMLLAKSICLLPQGAPLKLCTIVKQTATYEGNNLHGFDANTMVGFTRSLQNEQQRLRCKVIDVEHQQSDTEYILQVFHEIWSSKPENFVAFNEFTRCIPKLQRVSTVRHSLELPNSSGRFQLILPETRSINDLKFGFLDLRELGTSEIEIEVMASALNFRDVLNILKPSEYFKNSNAVGFDFAGVIRRVGPKVTKWLIGDFVFGLNKAFTALPSHIIAHENEVLRVPANLTFCEASTLPAVVMTSYHCLIEVANIKPNDTVLIHAASGGVGLSAIQICQNIGATVIATAGSKRKQNYLRNLGVPHVFYSRNTQYLADIMKCTNGRGVDVVLNSLTSEGFKEATLQACASGARFVEMSRISIWSTEEIKKLRPDIQYTTVDLTKFNDAEWLRLFTKLEEMLQTKMISPIPYTRFDAVDIKQALTYLQKAKHIGKIVCVMPKLNTISGKRQVDTPMFNENVTYLITGGLGGIGFEVCKWMLKMGAKYILIAGRKHANLEMKQNILKLNNNYNSHVCEVQLDVSDLSQCKCLFQTKVAEMGYPELKGVMHAAGTLNDNTIENHTWESFSSTFHSKVQGSFNLHHLTKDIKGLEHFVLFSSVASFLGPPGQTNHAAANCYEDALAHYRYFQGLPATSINWGQWGEVGVATEIQLHGIKPLSTKQGLLALEYALKTQRVQIAVNNFESIATVGKIVPTFSTYLDERVWKSEVGSTLSGISNELSTEQFWKKYDTKDSIDDKAYLLKESLQGILRRVMKLEETDAIDDDGNFQEMGVDSLMFVEIKNALQTLLGSRFIVSASVLKDCTSINSLASTLVQQIEGVSLAQEETPPTEEDLVSLVNEDTILPSYIKVGEDQVRVNIKNVSCVLLTGVTGTLGPFILKELCELPQIKQVICLIRTKQKTTPDERLGNVLQNRELLKEVNLTKVRCITGNISETHFALEHNAWTDFSDSVDAIVHCAVKVEHGEFYRRRNAKEDTRATNVQGLKNVLEFACSGKKLKQVFYASSIVATTKINESGNLSENWPDTDDHIGLGAMAYPISKFVGDFLMKTAILERSIPGKVFRFPLIGGDSKSGNFLLDKNHMMHRYLFILKEGVMPSNPVPLVILPVDYCAKISVKLFFNPTVPDDVFNVYNKDAALDQEFIDVANKLGYKVDLVEFSDFLQIIDKCSTVDSPFAIFKDFYKHDKYLMSSYSTAPALKQWVIEGSSSGQFFASTKIKKYMPEFYNDNETSMNTIYRDFLFAKNKGWLQKYTM